MAEDAPAVHDKEERINRGGGVTLVIFGWGCAFVTLGSLPYTRMMLHFESLF